MQIKLDDVVLFEISDADIKILENDLIDVQAEITQRLKYIVTHKVEQCYKRMRDEWTSKLEQSKVVASVPLQRDDFVNLILSQPDYKNRAMREAEVLNDN